jgi:hypothetical protein
MSLEYVVPDYHQVFLWVAARQAPGGQYRALGNAEMPTAERPFAACGKLAIDVEETRVCHKEKCMSLGYVFHERTTFPWPN